MRTNSNRLWNQEASSASGPSPVQGGVALPTANPSNGTAEASTSAVAGASSARWEAMKHNPGLVLEWCAEEQAILEEGLSEVYATPEMAMQMPPFQTKINIELTNSILPGRIKTNIK